MSCLKWSLCLSAFLASFSTLDGANILVLHPIYSGSHEHVLRNVGEHLMKNRGHNVTQVTCLIFLEGGWTLLLISCIPNCEVWFKSLCWKKTL